AGLVDEFIQEAYQGTAPMWIGGSQEPWMERMRQAGVALNRGLCKGPVMVLPYGGSLEAIRQAVKDKVLEQVNAGDSTETIWHRYEGDNYEAFRERTLAEHPLFNKDIGALAVLIHQSIAPVIPRAMAAMKALQEIAGWVGTRGLSWRT